MRLLPSSGLFLFLLFLFLFPEVTQAAQLYAVPVAAAPQGGRNSSILRALRSFPAPASAPVTSPSPPYFQQYVGYDIAVTLDDERHELHARLTLRYGNHSPDTLRSIPFHLWPRAYSNDRTALAQQLLRQGKTDFHFAPKEQRGTLDSLAFTVNGKAAVYAYDAVHPDVCVLQLPAPLLPGDSLTIQTPFRVKIPASFSRLGHVGESYQISQWYPKPAVYDRTGWHPIPYLDQGEFYSEFGDFHVQLTLPENYRVAATGKLKVRSERQWLLQQAAADRAALKARTDLSSGYVAEDFPPSSTTLKTISWQATQVHDFAWFADKRFRVLHDTLQLAGAPAATDVWAFFTETEAAYWTEATAYLKRATRFFSRHVGTYPYPQVTAVQAALSAGGGMEYPMITVIGRNPDAISLDEVLAHEVAHNWFYGVLGSNERDHAWMDEGLTSYYEQRYMTAFHPDHPSAFPVIGTVDYHRLGYHYLARQGKIQAPDTPADSLGPLNYWVAAYSQPSLAMQELEHYVGQTAVDEGIRTYFQQWQFKHPQPEDFFTAMETAIARPLRPWFPASFLSTATSDWQRDRPRGWRHNGQRRPPAPDRAARGLFHPLNLWTRPGASPAPQVSFGWLTAQQQPGQRQYFLLPLAGFNRNDGFLAGMALHNRTLEPRRLTWLLAPLYGFRSGQLNGFAGLRYRIPRPLAGTRQLLLATGTQRFHDFTLARTDEPYAYQRTALRATLALAHPPRTERESALSLQLISLLRQRPAFRGDTLPSGTRTEHNFFIRAGYTRELKREINPRQWSVFLEYKNRDETRSPAFEAAHLRLEATFAGGYQYEADRWLRWRLFGGYFLLNDLRESAFRPATALNLVDNAASDYRYDELYFGRGTQTGFAGTQQSERQQGGFRAPISSALAFGSSNQYLTALNIDTDLPLGRLPLVAFFDGGLYGERTTSNAPLRNAFRWVGGIGVSLLEGRVGIYAPLVADPTTRNLIPRSFPERLSLRLNLSGHLPWRWIDLLP